MAKPYTIKAEGMMCQACVESVTDGFQKLDENAKVIIDLENQTITVEMDTLSKDQAETIITERGYKFISIDN